MHERITRAVIVFTAFANLFLINQPASQNQIVLHESMVRIFFELDADSVFDVVLADVHQVLRFPFASDKCYIYIAIDCQ